MKLLLTAIFAGMLSFGTVVSAKEESKKETSAVAEAPKTKKICVDVQGKDGKPVIDPKTKKPKQDCKEVKIREKHEGTVVPDGKKK
jgi:hypothetical protein